MIENYLLGHTLPLVFGVGVFVPRAAARTEATKAIRVHSQTRFTVFILHILARVMTGPPLRNTRLNYKKITIH